MAVGVKICGVSTPQAVSAALEGGAAYLGFMFFPASPRNIAPEAAERLARPARGRAAVVAVTVDPDDVLLDRLTSLVRPDYIQLHGKESPRRVLEIAQWLGVGVIKALPAATAADVDLAAPYEDVADHLLFDAKPPPDATRPGGLGLSIDASILSGRRFQRPWFLAGGLDPWNVAAAIAASGAPMVDVSSGVERGPGLKDPALISSFLDAVRRV
jgi:phosphoribosylanthranilate isomerase